MIQQEEEGLLGDGEEVRLHDVKVFQKKFRRPALRSRWERGSWRTTSDFTPSASSRTLTCLVLPGHLRRLWVAQRDRTPRCPNLDQP